MATHMASSPANHQDGGPEPTPDPERESRAAPGRSAFLQSFVYAFAGVRYVVRTQRNMRVHMVLAALALAAGIWLHISPVEFALVFMAIVSVVVSEMFNTVVEACVDLASPRYHPLAKVAKDVAAGAVLVNAALSVIIGLLVFVPHLLALWGHR